MTKNNISQKIIQKARDAGYVDCNLIDISTFDKFSEKVKDRIDIYPEAEEVYQDLLTRRDPKNWFSKAEAVVVCTWWYGQYRIPDKVDRYIGRNYLFDGRNNYSENYQARKELEKYMNKLGLEYRKGGVPDRWAAVRAGVGSFGKNNFIYTEHGSWVNVETWLIDTKAETVNRENNLPCPEGCRKCIDACPTGALEAKFRLNPRACIPYLTYDYQGLTPEKYRSSMGAWLYGCDVCQNVCPLNAGQWEEKKEYPYLQEIASKLSPASILEMEEDFFQEEIYSRFFYSKDIVRWKMNALRALANEGDYRYRPLFEKYQNSEHRRLRKMAVWGLQELAN